MSLNKTVSAERVHISFFGLRNAGKSSLVNAITGQNLSLVSEVKGTTTDPVKKAMELLPLGPVVIIDTPGLDDLGELGKMRVARAKQIISQTDIAILVVDGQKGILDIDREIISTFKDKGIPYIVVFNKADLLDSIPETKENEIYVSAEKKQNINKLKEMIVNIAKTSQNDKKILADLISCHDTVVLVIPIDSSAPKGRLILPQQQTIRELLDIGATVVLSRETELKDTLFSLNKLPKLVITDSQVFGEVSKIVPDEIMLTSFSILFARYKGDLETVVTGAVTLDKLEDGDKVLISEGCTHHRQCNDIGSVKLPNLIKNYTKKDITFSFTSGEDFPENLDEYALIVHCGGCMLNEKEMKSRLAKSLENGTPITNYGIAIAQMHGILMRSVKPFPQIFKLLEK